MNPYIDAITVNGTFYFYWNDGPPLPSSLLQCKLQRTRRSNLCYGTWTNLWPRRSRAYEGGRQAPRPSLPVSLPLKGAPMSDESTWENYINSLLKFVIWKWVHDRIGYIVKNGINKGDFKGGHTNKNLAPPPYTNTLAGPCVAPLVLNLRTSMPKANLSGSY